MRSPCVPLFTFVLLILVTLNVVAQEKPPRTATWESPEFGEISEIAGLTKVYVHCDDLKVRQRIVNELRKEPVFEIVDRVDRAEILIRYSYRSITWTRDRGILGTSAKTTRHDGDLIVSVAGSVDDQNRVHQRIVWSISKDREESLGKDPYIKGTKAFLEDYRRARSAENASTRYGAAKVATDGSQPPQKEAAKPEAQNKKDKPWYEMEKP